MTFAPIMLNDMIRAAFPAAGVELDRPLRDDGEWWLDIHLDGFRSTVSWLASRGFGIYLGEGGYGARPDEIYAEPALAFARLRNLLEAARTGHMPTAMGVGQVRKMLGHTQNDLARTLATGQANISRIESRANPTLGSLRALVEAMGGALEVRARFPRFDVPMALPEADHDA